jgi:NDP-sugar pyrophosphorylase family protein
MQENKVTGEFFSGDWRDSGTPERLADLDTFLSNGTPPFFT